MTNDDGCKIYVIMLRELPRTIYLAYCLFSAVFIIDKSNLDLLHSYGVAPFCRMIHTNCVNFILLVLCPDWLKSNQDYNIQTSSVAIPSARGRERSQEVITITGVTPSRWCDIRESMLLFLCKLWYILLTTSGEDRTKVQLSSDRLPLANFSPWKCFAGSKTLFTHVVYILWSVFYMQLSVDLSSQWLQLTFGLPLLILLRDMETSPLQSSFCASNLTSNTKLINRWTQ